MKTKQGHAYRIYHIESKIHDIRHPQRKVSTPDYHFETRKQGEKETSRRRRSYLSPGSELGPNEHE